MGKSIKKNYFDAIDKVIRNYISCKDRKNRLLREKEITSFREEYGAGQLAIFIINEINNSFK